MSDHRRAAHLAASGDAGRVPPGQADGSEDDLKATVNVSSPETGTGSSEPRVPNPLLRVSDLEVTFPVGRHGAVRAVRGISYEVMPGEAVGFVGESGSGKSVSVLALLGLLPAGARISGTALFEGSDLLTMAPRRLRSVLGIEIGFVFQDPLSGLDPTMTVGKQVVEALAIHKQIGRKEATSRAIEILDLVGIPQPRKRLRQFPHEFSGGMRQRVMIAAALATEPALLIADEPTTALDVTIQAQVIELLHRLSQELSMSVMLITHDLGVVARLVARINVMYAGRIVEAGRSASVLSDPQHPYTEALLRSVPRIDGAAKKLEPISGAPPDPRSLPMGCAFVGRCPRELERCRDEFPPTYRLGTEELAECWLHDPTRSP